MMLGITWEHLPKFIRYDMCQSKPAALSMLLLLYCVSLVVWMFLLLLDLMIRTFLFSHGLKQWEFAWKVLSLYVNISMMLLGKCFFYDMREELLSCAWKVFKWALVSLFSTYVVWEICIGMSMWFLSMLTAYLIQSSVTDVLYFKVYSLLWLKTWIVTLCVLLCLL